MVPTRQLAAIMFADIVGYTALMETDELRALQFRNKLKTTLEEEVNAHHGRLLQFRGDGALCSFSSTTEGVRAALNLQLNMQTEPIVPLRIGMHTGDVVMSGDDIYGDGVNIASRMESFAVPGSIFISGKAHDDIKNQPDIESISLGRYLLKNVKTPVEIYAISNAGIRIPGSNDLEGKGERAQQHCILVLPFLNLGNDADQEFFSDGLTEELITALSGLKDMKVISRTTSMLYKGSKKDIKTIQQETNASYIMEGSVRRQGSALRITAQFIDASRDVHLWAETFRGTMDDIFDIQEQVSAKIVEALRVQLTMDERQQLQKRYTDNMEAYQLYLQGRYFWSKREEEALNKALRYFEKAIETDEQYALAWAGIADTYHLLGEFTNQSRRDLYPKARAAADRALAIDDQLAEAHVSLASLVLLHDWDWATAGKGYRKGIELNPNYATGHHWYAEWLAFTGKKEAALWEITLATELDPVSPAILEDKGIILYYSRRYDEAIATALKVRDLDPGFISTYRLLSLAYLGKGLYDQALDANRQWGERTGNPLKTRLAAALIHATAGDKKQALELLETIDNNALRSNDYRAMAQVYVALGEQDKAFEWLDKSVEHHEESLCSLQVDPKLDVLHADKRFGELLKKIGLPQG